MICRKIHLPDQSSYWFLISQIEHARISGQLARHCLSHLEPSMAEELVQAIVHHDDGWSAWELGPTLDAAAERPLQFYELPIAASLEIWSRSIEVAATIGPRAGWVVASHFIALLDARSESLPALAVQWREEMKSARSDWDSAWRSSDEASESLGWLQLLDVASLWLCGKCPGVGEALEQPPDGYRFAEGQALETDFSGSRGRAQMRPWRLDVSEVELVANGWIVPIREYCDAGALLEARAEHTVVWRLVS